MQVAEKTHRARIVTKAEVFKLLQNGRNVVGCEYRKAGKVVKAGGSAGGSGENLEAVWRTWRTNDLILTSIIDLYFL